MPRDDYELARKALTTLEFYQMAFASSQEYQTVHAQVVGYLRNRADAETGKNNASAKFLYGFADTLDEANKPGAYVKHP